MAVVQFAAGAGNPAPTSVLQNWTATEANVRDRFQQDPSRDPKLSYVSGTNYEKALQVAYNDLLAAGKSDSDPTYVIFMTDGQPSQSVTSGNVTNPTTPSPPYYGNDHRTRKALYKDALDEVDSIMNRENTYFYGIYAFGNEDDFLDDMVYYANYRKERADSDIDYHTNTAGVEKTYFNASNVDQFNDAIDQIFNDILDAIGVSSVSIADGTTSSVQASSGEISHLLEVDDTSFTYWLNVPINADNKFSRKSLKNGQTIEYTIQGSDGTYTISWTDEENVAQSVTVNGEIIEASEGKPRSLKYQWINDTARTGQYKLYGQNPPNATFNSTTGSVDWNLDSVGTLLTGVSYSVQFDVFPSQYTYDLIAQLKNGTLKYSDLTDAERTYLKKTEATQELDDKESEYILATNTTAKLKYKDMREATEENPNPGYHEEDYVNPEPVVTTSSQLKVTKEWDPLPDPAPEITLTVTKDGENFYEAVLNKDNQYSAAVNISTGLMRVSYQMDEEGQPTDTIAGIQVLDEGHDYTFAEMDDSSYYWDLDAEIVRPMLINSATQISNLVLVEDAEKAAAIATAMDANKVDFLQQEEDGKAQTYFRIKGYVYHLSSEADTGQLTATNAKRSHLFLYKAVTGGGPENTQFNFKLTVNAAYSEHIVNVEAVEGAEDTYQYTNQDDITVTVKKDTVHPSLYIAKYISKEGSTVVLYGTVADGKFTYKEAMWFSMWDYTASSAVKGLAPTGWTEETTADGSGTTGYYYAPAGTVLETSMSANNNIRFGNVPAGTTYTFEEFGIPSNYSFVQAEKSVEDADNTNKQSLGIVNDSPSITGTLEESNKNYSVTFTNSYDLTSYSVTKEWDDNDDQDRVRPETVNVQLYANNQKYGDPVTLPVNGAWTYEWMDLAKGVTYTAKELKASDSSIAVGNGEKFDDNYVAAYEVTDTSTTITNTHTPETIDIPVSKVWDDENNRDKIRPETVTINLIAGEGEDAAPVEGKTVTLSESNSWKDSFTGLPKYNDGEEIKYSVEEVKTDVITGTDGIGTYAIAVSGSVTAGFVVTNTHTFAVTTATVKKVWHDAENQDGKRPESLTVTLLANGEAVMVSDDSGEETPVTATLSDANNWSAEKTDLPMYSEDGTRIAYTWTEGDPAPDGYTLTGNTTVDVTDEDGNITGVITTLTNTHTPEVTKETVVKVWNDNDDQDGVRPDSLTVALLANGEAVTDTVTDDETGEETEQPVTVTLNEDNDWTASVTDLPKYAEGTIIKYTWDETDLPDSYSLTKTEIAADKDEAGTVIGTITTLTNTHNPDVTEATVEKVWDDNNDQDGMRPESLTMTLLADGVSTGKTVTLSDDNEWKDTLTGLPVNDGGTPIVYSWAEPEISGYTPKEGDPVTTGTVTTFTNKHTPEQTQATVVKVWDDANDQDGKRPDGLQVSLKNGKGEDAETVATFTLNEDNKWTATASNIPKYAAGEEIEYVWAEDNLPDGYSLTKTEIAEDKDEAGTVIGTITTLTNSHTPEVTEATVKKVWDDSDDKAGKRPDSLTVALLADGEAVTVKVTDAETGEETEEPVTVTLNEENNWTDSVTDLPKYAEGKVINYTWDEGMLPIGYVLTKTETTEDKDGETVIGTTTTLTNTLKMGDLVIKKDLTKYNDFVSKSDGKIIPEPVTFIFKVTAKWNGRDIYEGYEALSFDGTPGELTKSITLTGKLPVGADVTVEETYSGAGYDAAEGSTKTWSGKINEKPATDAEVATASFTNAYNNENKTGYGVINSYSKGETGWNVEQDNIKPGSED